MCMLLFAMVMLPGCSDSSDNSSAASNNAQTAAPAPETNTPAPEAQPTPPPEVTPAAGYQPTLAVEPTMPARYDANDWEVRDQVRKENPVDAGFIASLNEFAYKTSATVLSDADENRNFSPISLYYALALTATGTAGNTKAEFGKLLGTDDMEALAKQSGNLFRLLYTDNDITKLKLANSLWLREGFIVNDAYIANAVAQFYAWVYNADFANPEAATAVAKWIAANTNGTIEPQITLERDTMMLIINTVYFYDEWQEAFQKAETAPDKFVKADGTEVDADFMQKTFGSKVYYKGEGFSRVDLGLKGQGTMALILPDKGVDVNSFLADAAKLKAAFESGAEDHAKVIVKLPKFKFGSEFELVDALQKLGLNDAFGDSADFSVLSPEDGLYISDVIQQSHIGLNENGVEAAAYTMVAISKMSMPIELEKTVELKFDRPFIFGIKAEGTLLFIGVCDVPETE